ncbi:tyrosine-type recombinase/integrase [Mesobacillus foraminis]|uniref:tyrosine-type recombinase/integrase n=1 Tax=Mesobacillus foraminis TaxID=279826 RepID=UPI0039A28638
MARRGRLTDEELKIVNAKITDEEAFKKFIRDCHLKNLRPSTIKYYNNEPAAVKVGLAELGIDKEVVELDQEDIETLILHLKEKIKVVSINTRLRAIKAFFNYLEKNKLLYSNNPTKNIKQLRDRQKITETLEDQEIVLVAKHIKNQKSFVGYRDFSIFMIMIDTGIRLSECIGIKTNDGRENKIIIRSTKNNQDRTIYPTAKTKDAISKYLTLRGNLHYNFLFVNIDNEPLQRRSVQTRFEKYKEALKFKKQLSPLVFRHTYAKRAIMSGMDAFSLAALLGHSDLTVTKRYVSLWGADLEEKAKKFSSINRLKI